MGVYVHKTTEPRKNDCIILRDMRFNTPYQLLANPNKVLVQLSSEGWLLINLCDDGNFIGATGGDSRVASWLGVPLETMEETVLEPLKEGISIQMSVDSVDCFQ